MVSNGDSGPTWSRHLRIWSNVHMYVCMGLSRETLAMGPKGMRIALETRLLFSFIISERWSVSDWVVSRNAASRRGTPIGIVLREG